YIHAARVRRRLVRFSAATPSDPMMRSAASGFVCVFLPVFFKTIPQINGVLLHYRSAVSTPELLLFHMKANHNSSVWSILLRWCCHKEIDDVAHSFGRNCSQSEGPPARGSIHDSPQLP